MIDKTTTITPRYIAPTAKVVSISNGAHILQSSLEENPSVNGYREGSDSNYGFGDED